MSNRQWNVVAAMAVLLTLFYVASCAAAWLMGKVTFTEFGAVVGPVVGGWVGWMAAMLPKREG